MKNLKTIKSKEERMYEASTKKWMKTQKVSIASCDLSIKHCQENIAMSKRMIKAEQEEKRMKIKLLKEVQKSIQ